MEQYKAQRSSSPNKCKRCLEYFGADSIRAQYCNSCYLEKKKEWGIEAYQRRKKGALTKRKS